MPAPDIDPRPAGSSRQSAGAGAIAAAPMSVAPMMRATLARPDDLDGFRLAIRSALALGLGPHDLDWAIAGTTDGLAPAPALPALPDAPAPRVPRRFVELAGLAICNRSPDRFRLLHSLLVRLQTAPRLLADRADPEVDSVLELANSVSRERSRMRAFLRFHETQDDGGRLCVAWFEPSHHVLRLDIGFHIRRLAARRWTILTPDLSVHWDGEAVHWLPGAPKAEVPTTCGQTLPGAEPVAGMAAVAQARTAERIAGGTWADLRMQALDCRRCPLHGPATQTVFGEGPAGAALMIVGEQPGDQEDRQGRPFVGPAGQLLDRCLAAAGIDRAAAYVTNAVKHFRFEARGHRRIHSSPSPAEISACRWWLDREIELVNPRLILMLGASAARSFLGRPVTVGRERGRPIPLAGGRSGFLTVHPSYLLRIENPAAAASERDRFIADLRAAAALAQAGPA